MPVFPNVASSSMIDSVDLKNGRAMPRWMVSLVSHPLSLVKESDLSWATRHSRRTGITARRSIAMPARFATDIALKEKEK